MRPAPSKACQLAIAYIANPHQIRNMPPTPVAVPSPSLSIPPSSMPTPNGLIGSVQGVVTHTVRGVYQLCFLDSGPDKFTATLGATITIAA